MSKEAREWAWQQDIRGDLKVLLLALADHADKKGVSWPNKNTLMLKTRLSRRGVRLFIQRLETEGLLKVVHRFRENGSQTSNEYHLNMEGVHNTCTPPVHSVCTPPVQDSAPLNEQSLEQSEGTINCGKPQEEDLNIDEIMAQHQNLTQAEIFEAAKRKDGKLTADGCAYLWRHCRASAGDNGFQAELLIKEKKMLREAYKRVGEDYPMIVWRCMSNWIGFTKFAEKTGGAFNCPLNPTVSFFVKFIESAANFMGSNDNSEDEGFVQLTAKKNKPLTKPSESGDNASDAISNEELLAMSEEINK